MTDRNGYPIAVGARVLMLTDEADDHLDDSGTTATFTVLAVRPDDHYLVQLDDNLDPQTIALLDQANAWLRDQGEAPYDPRDPVEIPGTQLLHLKAETP